MRPILGVLFLTAFPVLLLAADSPKGKNLIVGNWKSVGEKGVTFEFKSDGTMTAMLGEKRFLSGKYKFTANDTMAVEGTLAFRVGATIDNGGKEVPYKRTYKITEVKNKNEVTIKDGTLIRKLQREK